MRGLRVLAGISAGVVALACSWTALAAPGGTPAAASAPIGWSPPRAVDTSAPFAVPNSLSAVACPTVKFCLAGDQGGNLLVSNAPAAGSSAWRQTASGFRNENHDLTGVAELICPSAGFCLAAVSQNESAPYSIFTSTDPAGGFTAWHQVRRSLLPQISCPSSALCASTWGHHLIYSVNPAAGGSSVWKTITLSQLTDLSGVSCPTRSFCVATDNAGNVYTSSDPTGGAKAWKSAFVDHTAGIDGPTCASPSFCAAVDGQGNLLYSVNPSGGASAWHQASVPAGVFSLTCLSSSFCYTRTGTDVLTTSDPAGGAGTWHDTDVLGSNFLGGLACASPAMCVAVTGGSVVTTTSPGGGPSAWNPAEIDGVNTIASLYCAGLVFCFGGDDEGNLLDSTNPAAGGPTFGRLPIGGTNGVFTAFSCPVFTFCVAADSQGDILWASPDPGEPSSWHLINVDGSNRITSVDCPTYSLCVAADSAGNIVSSADPLAGASSWHVATLPGDPGPLYVTCVSATFCVSTGKNTILTSTDPAGGASAWPVTASIPAANGIGPVACPSVSLCVAVGEYVYSVNDGPQAVIYSTRQPGGSSPGWHAVPIGDGNGPDQSGTAISCPSASLCLASVAGFLVDSTDPASGEWQSAGLSARLVSCPTTTICLAVSGANVVQVGRVLTPTTTVITSAPASVRRGQKVTVKFRVTAAGNGTNGTPLREVTVSYSDDPVCRGKLSGSGGTATGQCSFRPSKLGHHLLAASYPQRGLLFGGSSGTRRLDVSR